MEKWNHRDRSALIRKLARGEISVAEAARKHDIPLDTLQGWVNDFFSTAKGSLDEARRTLLVKQGIQVDDSNTDLSGRLEEIACVDLLQTLGQNRKTGIITITSSQGNGQLWLRNGVLIDAEAGSLGGIEAVYRILSFERGAFTVRFREHDRTDVIESDLNPVLMEAMRRLDESKKLLARLPDADLVIKTAPAAATLAHANPDYRAIVTLFSPGRTITEVLAESPLDNLATLKVIDELSTRRALTTTTIRRERVVSGSASGLSTSSGLTRPPPNAAPKRNLWQFGLAAALVLGTVVFLGILLIEPDDPADAKDSSGTVAKDKPKPEPTPETKAKKPPPPRPKPCPEGMIFHRGGKLYVGSPSESPMLSMARPPHQVKVSSFCLDRYEVTVAKFRECSKTGECERAYRESIWPKGSRKKPDWERSQKIHSELCNEGQEGREQHPVNCVSWFQAKRFCETRGKRLPFEVEWEFAARGSDGRVYPWGDEPPGPNTLNACGSECRAWRIEHELGDTPVMYETDDGWVGTAPVGSYPQGRTQSGVDDMIGNLFEWTADGFYMYEEDAGSEITVDPRGPVEAERRIIRGGAFNSTNPVHTDPALRFPQVPDTHTHGIGFRCARNPDFEPPETKAEAKAEAEAKTKAEAEAKTEAKTEADST